MKTTIVILFLAAAAVCLGGCGDSDCEVVCAKNVECQVDSPGEDACVSECEDLSEDSAYADGIADQASCYEGKSCAAIANGVCNPDYS